MGGDDETGCVCVKGKGWGEIAKQDGDGKGKGWGRWQNGVDV